MTFETDLHRAKGLGSAQKGVSHWITQRVTAVALIPLSIWFVGAFLMLLTAPFDQVCLWLASSWNITFIILFMLTSFYHGYLGMQVIWEDYISHEGVRWGLILATKFLSAFFALLAIVCILKVHLG